MNCAVLVNFSANHDSGKKSWDSIKDKVLQILPQGTCVVPYQVPFDMEACIKELIMKEKMKYIISAGGDGSVNYILNSIIQCKGEHPTDLSLGAIGLGSSNDFLKPSPEVIMGIPCKINTKNPRCVDIGKATFLNKNLEKQTRYFIINASLGFTALGNFLFNKGGVVIDKIKSQKLVNLAIYVTALKTLMMYKNEYVYLHYGSLEEEIRLTNLSVVKNPNISGNFRYDQAIKLDDGFLGVNFCHDMGKLEVIKILIDLMKGKFSGKPKRKSFLAKSVKVEMDDFMPFEMDGEVQLARNIEFSVIAKAIQVLGA